MDCKVCTKCGVEKPLDEFGKQRGRPLSQCKRCRSAASSEWKKANPQRVAERSRAWEQSRRGQRNAQHRAWRAANKDVYNARRRGDPRQTEARRAAVLALTPSYIARALCIPVPSLTPELIELKRQQLLLGRALREAKSLTKESEDDQAE